MLLAIDIGNTEITAGLFAGERLEAHWRLTTSGGRTPDEWAATLTAFFAQGGRSTHGVHAAVLASVAPHVTAAFADGVREACGVVPVEVGPASDLPLTLDVEEPLSVGADRVVNTLAAARLYERDTIVVDFGTATTFDCITADGRFLGGVIAPGLRTAADDLTRRASKLPAIDLTPPEHVIGRRTDDCLRAGILFGTVDAVDGIVRRIRAEWPGGGTPYVVATGGLAARIAPLTKEIEHVEPHLTLIGLRFAAACLHVTG
ncbi:MAG TPA: type III pantothenate kinase [Gemmatimonadales bacterium]|nr:type III pantothenate kinase [Gemmatimonadales bacterium]